MPQMINVERRILQYEDYLLSTDDVHMQAARYQEFYQIDHELPTAEHVRDLTIRWHEHGEVGMQVTFAAPTGGRFRAELLPPQNFTDDWHVEVYRIKPRKCVKGNELFCRLEGQEITTDDIIPILIAAACVQADAEKAGYPRHEE